MWRLLRPTACRLRPLSKNFHQHLPSENRLIHVKEAIRRRFARRRRGRELGTPFHPQITPIDADFQLPTDYRLPATDYRQLLFSTTNSTKDTNFSRTFCCIRITTCQNLVSSRKFFEPRRALSTRRQNGRQGAERIRGFPEIGDGLPLVNPLFLRVLRDLRGKERFGCGRTSASSVEPRPRWVISVIRCFKAGLTAETPRARNHTYLYLVFCSVDSVPPW